MTKKYQIKHNKYEVVVHAENGPNKDYPLVFSYKSVSGEWCPSLSKSLNSPDCIVEEVPEEPIKVGYEFNHNGQMCKVVYQLAGKEPTYLVTIMYGDEEYPWEAEDGYLWNENDIREAEASD